MNKCEVKCEQLNKYNVLHRSSLRGLKKCTSCGFINGQRALICRNVNCDLRIKRLASIKPFDPIQLTTYSDTKVFSLRTKEKLLNPRNFVSITESTSGAAIVSRKAICYVDSCKYNAYDSSHICCKHIKACAMITKLTLAEVYPIDRGILWNLNIPDEQKHHLWDLYQLEEKRIPPVQKLNPSTFVVKCTSSKMFPASRLHVTVFGSSVPNKNGEFSCSCKKLKIVLEPDNSVTMKKEICDHLLLVLAAILNKPEGKSLYGCFLDSLQYLWMPTSLNPPIIDCNTRPTQLMDFDLDLEKCNASMEMNAEAVDHNHPDDLFSFSEELFAENNIPDFSDIILDVNATEKVATTIPVFKKTIESSSLEMHIKDPKLNAPTTPSITDEDLDLNFPLSPPLTASPTTSTQNSIDFNDNSLSVIEHFQLDHNIQLSNDNIALAKDIENLNNLESQVLESNSCSSLALSCNGAKQTSLLKTPIISNGNIKVEDLDLKSPATLVPKPMLCPAVPANKTIIFKQSPVKIIKIATPTGIIQKLPTINNKIIQISKINPNKIIVLKSNHSVETTNNQKITNSININGTSPVKPPDPIKNNAIQESSATPSLSYEAWLDHIIEVLNDSIAIQDSATNVKHAFHVPEAIFSYFSKTFGLNNNRRLPNITTLIKSGKYKDHIKYGWYFNQASTVQRIFATNNAKLELERCFERLNDGSFELHTPKSQIITNNNTINNKYRPIYAKPNLQTVFIKLSNTPDVSTNVLQPHKSGLKLEWLPSAFPKSNFGLMTIEFCVSVKEET